MMKKGGREREWSKHTYTGETPSAFFKQHQSRERERETFDENAHNLHKALSNREKKKSGYFDKNLLELVKEEKKMRKRE
jgi:hypothetical protein